MRNNSKNVKYQDLLKVCIDYFGEPRTHWGLTRRIQDALGRATRGSTSKMTKAKRSRTRWLQVLAAIDKIDDEGKQS